GAPHEDEEPAAPRRRLLRPRHLHALEREHEVAPPPVALHPEPHHAHGHLGRAPLQQPHPRDGTPLLAERVLFLEEVERPRRSAGGFSDEHRGCGARLYGGSQNLERGPSIRKRLARRPTTNRRGPPWRCTSSKRRS